MPHDVIVVGAGPAGMSAALILGRCGRDVLVLDSNEPRNHASPALHGFLTRDGVDPWKLRELGRADLTKYPSVTLRQAKVESARRSANGFEVSTQSGEIEQTRLLLLATGRIDPLPDVAGFREFYGRGVHHCPYCDGWEHRGKKLAVFGSGRPAEGLALELTTWSKDVAIYSNGKSDWQPASRRFPLVTHPIAKLQGDAHGLQAVQLSNGELLECDALFFCSECTQRSSLPEQLGCEFDDDASVICEKHAAKGVPGLYIAGNVRGGVHLAITAAAEGAEAAMAINDVLLETNCTR
jgi:thioredoxin reductase